MPWVWQDDGAGAQTGQQWNYPNQGYNQYNPWSAIPGAETPSWDMGAGWTGQQGQENLSWLTNLYMPYQQMMMEQYGQQMQFGEGQRRFDAEQAAKIQQQQFEQNVRWPQEQQLHRGLANVNVWGGWNAPNRRYL